MNQDDDDNDIYIIKSHKKKVHRTFTNKIAINDINSQRRILLSSFARANHRSQVLESLSSLVTALNSSNANSIKINECSHISTILSLIISLLNNDIMNIRNNTTSSIIDNNLKHINDVYRNTSICHDLFKKLYHYLSNIAATTIGLHQVMSYLSYHIREGIPLLMTRILKYQIILIRSTCYNIFDTYTDANTFIIDTNTSNQKVRTMMLKKGYNEASSSSSLINIVIVTILMPLLNVTNNSNGNNDKSIVSALLSSSINTTLVSLLSYITSKRLSITTDGIITLYSNVVQLQDFIVIAKQTLRINTGPLILDVAPWSKADAILLLLQNNSDDKVSAIDVHDGTNEILAHHEIRMWTSLISTPSVCSSLYCKSSRSLSKIHAIMTIDRSKL